MLLLLAPFAFAAVAADTADRPTVRSLDTRITFQMEAGAPVVRAVERTPHDTNLARPCPETALPETVTAAGQTVKVVWVCTGFETTGRQVAFVYRCEEPALELRSVWTGSDLPGPVEHTLTLANRSDAAVEFAPTPALALELALDPQSQWEHVWIEKGASFVTDEGVHIDAMGDGYRKALHCGPTSTNHEERDAMPWACLHDRSGRRGVYCGVEFTGWTTINVRKHSAGLSLAAGTRDFDGATRTVVPPGGRFEFPACFVGAYEGDLDDGCNRLHRWIEKRLRPPVPGGVTPVLVNNSWGSGMAVDEAMAKRMIEDCADLGIEMYHVDAGWFREVGDWHDNPEKFPNGLRAIADYTHSKGLKFGLWVGWTQGGHVREGGERVLSVFNSGQKQWFGHDIPDDWRNSEFTGVCVCLASREARQWCLRELRRMIDDYDLDLLEHDQEMVLQHCSREHHGHRPLDRADTSRAAAEGYYEVYDTILREYPDLLLENCVNGAQMVDFGVARRTHYFCSTDNYTELQLRRTFYDTSYPFPPSMIELYLEHHETPQLKDLKRVLRSSMLGWCTIMLDTTAWTPDQKRIAKREFALYKTRLRPLIASGDVYHVLPRPDGVNWDGIQYWDPITDSGALIIFRPGGETSRRIRLRGMDPAGTYAIEAEDGSAGAASASGQELLESGLEVTLRDDASSDIVFITPKD